MSQTRIARLCSWLVVAVCLDGSPLRLAAAQTLKLSSTLTIEKTDDKVKTHDDVVKLVNWAKEQKLEGNVIRFLQNGQDQLVKVLEAKTILEEKKTVEVPKEFSPAKYRVKAMTKLATKKPTVKKISAADLQKRLQKGEQLNFKEPMLVTNATELLASGEWDNIRRHWYGGRIAEDEQLEKKLKIEYWAPEKARARLVGNMLVQEEPELVPFSKYLIICFHGTPAKPKLPGQNTEHCEQSVDANSMVHNSSELQALDIFPEIKNALPIQSEFRKRLISAGGSDLKAMIGKTADNWIKRTGSSHFQHFVFGPSGSGDKLHAENGLPFFDILIHGHRRWLLLKEDEMNKVAEKAKEALEFDKTSAYLFFEEKLPELREEFGLKKFVEANQQPGDLVFVPSGWFRVSLSIADSISYYQTLLADKGVLSAVTDNAVWRPQFRQYQLAFCHDAGDLHKLPGINKGDQLHQWLETAISKVTLDEAIPGIMNVMLQCGSVLVLSKTMPELDVALSTVCSPKMWTQCRSMLVKKVEEKGVKASLDWLPKAAPTSIDDLAPVGGAKKAAADEL